MRTKQQEIAAYNYLRPKRVAEMLACSVEHVENLIEQGHLDAVDIACGEQRRTLRVDPKSVERFIRERRVVPSGDAEEAVG